MTLHTIRTARRIALAATLALVAPLAAHAQEAAAMADSTALPTFVTTGQQISAYENVGSPVPGSVALAEPPTVLVQRAMSGPRLGFTFAPGNDRAARALQDHGYGRVMSQFGWQFEHHVAPIGDGPELLTQVVPLFGGIEYGKLIPSLTVVLGARFANGFEFGVGPSLTLVNASGGSSSAIVFAAGRSVDFGGIRVPLNVAISSNRDGTRTTLSAGWSVRR